MQVHRFETASALMAVAGDFLMAKEALNNLPLGILSTFSTHPRHYPEAYFAAVLEADQVVLVALRTPPFNVVLSMSDREDALAYLAADLSVAFPDLPGVTGPSELTYRFAEIWQAHHAVDTRLQVAERIYELTSVHWPPEPAGSLRLATEADWDLLLAWFTDFHTTIATAPWPPAEAARRGLDRVFGDATAAFWLWQNPHPVSVVGSAAPTGTGIRVGPVYTPPAERKHGYASWLTAQVSQTRLNQGYRRIFLFTDLANPTSNKIYQAIGYRPVGDAAQLVFTARSKEATA